MHSNTSMYSLVCALLLFVCAVPSQADVIFGNITGQCCSGFRVSASDSGANSMASQFTPVKDHQFLDAAVEVFGGSGDPYFDMYLFSDAHGLPGSPIATAVTQLTAPPNGGVVTAFGPPVTLNANTPYWLVLTPYDPATFLGWAEFGSSAVSSAFTSDPNGLTGWNGLGTYTLQFEIDSVPEPGTVLLVGGGFAVLARRLRHRMPHTFHPAWMGYPPIL